MNPGLVKDYERFDPPSLANGITECVEESKHPDIYPSLYLNSPCSLLLLLLLVTHSALSSSLCFHMACVQCYTRYYSTQRMNSTSTTQLNGYKRRIRRHGRRGQGEQKSRDFSQADTSPYMP